MFNYVKFMAPKKVRHKFFLLPFLLLLDPGSGMDKSQDHPHHARHFGMLFSYEVYRFLVTKVTIEGVFTTDILISWSHNRIWKFYLPAGEKCILDK